jgi:hypothetical protein
MKKIALLSLCLLLPACTGPTYSEKYSLHIDPAFDEYTWDVLDAAEKWESSTGVVFVPHKDLIDCNKPANICITIGTEGDIESIAGNDPLGGEWLGVTHRLIDYDYSTILILDALLFPNLNPDTEAIRIPTLDSCILHELGHALGMQHDPQKHNVMYRSADGDEPYPTCRDIAQYFDLRGVNYNCSE